MTPSHPTQMDATPRLTSAQIEQGWRDTFSTGNPFCPCDLKTFTKAARWAEAQVRRECVNEHAGLVARLGRLRAELRAIGSTLDDHELRAAAREALEADDAAIAKATGARA